MATRSVVKIGERFGRLVVLGEAPATEFGHRRMQMRCDCGTEKPVRLDHMRGGKIVSCGCWGRDIGERTATHRRSESAEYGIWLNMRSRCTRPRHTNFSYYGGRGIRVCPEWLASFERFMHDVGPRPSLQHSLDRMDNDGPYAPGNVRWATKREQALNRRPKRKGVA